MNTDVEQGRGGGGGVTVRPSVSFPFCCCLPLFIVSTGCFFCLRSLSLFLSLSCSFRSNALLG